MNKYDALLYFLLTEAEELSRKNDSASGNVELLVLSGQAELLARIAKFVIEHEGANE